MDKESDLSQQDPTTIRHHIEETRTALTDKLETLEHEVRQTVRNATNAVVGTVQTVRETVEQTVDNVKEKVEGTVQSVRHTFDVNVQTDHHPWAMVGGSIAAGFLAGSLLPSPRQIRHSMHAWQTHQAHQPSATPYHVQAASAPATDYFRAEEPSPVSQPASQSAGLASHLIGELMSRFAPEIDKLKGLAIGAAMGVVRDMVQRSAPPPLAPQLASVIDSMTSKLGGEQVSGPVF